MFSTFQFVCHFICQWADELVPSVSMSASVNPVFQKRMNHFWCQLAQVVYGQVHEMINFGGQEVKDQGHTGLKMDFDTCGRHHCRPLWSSRFPDFLLYISIFIRLRT